MCLLKQLSRIFFICVSVTLTSWVRADTLYFQASLDVNGQINFSWFSPNNWYVPDGMGGFQHVFRVPVSGDNAILLTSVNAAANSISLVSLVIQPGVNVSGGDFSVGNITSGNGGSFVGSKVAVRSAWNLGSGFALSECDLVIEAGAFLFFPALSGGSTLTANSSSIYNVGEIIFANGSVLNFVGGTNQLWIRPNATISGSGSTQINVNPNAGIALTLYHDGTVRSDPGLLTLSTPNTLWTNSLGLGKFKTTAVNATIEIRGAMAVPPGSTNSVSGPGVTRFYADNEPSTIHGVLTVGAADSASGEVDPGTLESNRILNGGGLVQTISAPGRSSTLIWGGGAISVPNLNIDVNGRLVITGVLSKVLSKGAINNKGLTIWSTAQGNIHLNDGAIFNNDGTFDAQNQASLFGGVGILGTFNNRGTFKKSGGPGDTAVLQDNAPLPGAIFNNSGVVEIQQGRLVLMGGTNSGQYKILAGAELRISAFTNFQAAGSSFTGAGLFSANGLKPVIWLAVDAVIPNLDLQSSAVLNGPGTVTILNAMNMVSATAQGDGLINLSAGAALNVINATSSNLGRSVNNAGAARIASGINAQTPLVWNNLEGGSVVFENSNGALDFNYSGAPPTFSNRGAVMNQSLSSESINWAFLNNGEVVVNKGSLEFKQGFKQTSGRTRVDAGAILYFTRNPAQILGGTVSGNGNILGSFSSSGVVHPGNSPGILGITGNFTNNPPGALAITLAGVLPGSGYSRLELNGGLLQLGGRLSLELANGFLPNLNDRFVIATVANGARSGTFATIEGAKLPNGRVLVPIYRPTEVELITAHSPTISDPTWENSSFKFSYQSTAGLTNVIEYSDTLSPPLWQTLKVSLGDGGILSVSDLLPPGSQRFYRVRF